ncbi:DNA/RNA non-specific endonuclease [Sphingomonas sp. IC4-52]|uniref:DNA/RNA non-specific endonuclease n=1 Tax=Sphingomonas sp. IC4-52 TaxID=2887202 RepID=UPI001D12FEDA|nr:DNA/RNA non-specific endonuclease [Sphingomonas sp. IC4-52]MCC2981225.1 DNA/RNA non-specific endonuclease [Sphingomonas sp. IC4-52]
MTNEERLERVRRRATDAILEAYLKAVAAGTAPRPLLEGLSPAAAESMARGKAALEALPAHAAALEAIVQRYGRPPLLVSNDAVVLEPLVDLPPDTDVLIKAAEFRLRSVGRVEFVNSGQSWGGTGWLVDRRGGRSIVVTNRHVAGIVARRRADGVAVFMRAPSGARLGARLDFKEEHGSVAGDQSATVPVSDVTYLADEIDADVALLAIDAAGVGDRRPIDLDTSPIQVGELVALIGYPAYDSRNDDSDQSRYFRDLYEVKRFSPGRITQSGQGAEELSHDCTSLGGSSGGPLIRLGPDAGAVGLHFSGVYGKANSAVPARVVLDLLRGSLPTHSLMMRGSDVEAPDRHHSAEYFAGRTGFDQEHLGRGPLATPWPIPRTDLTADLAQPEPPGPSEPHEIAYTHFGVKYSATKRLALVTAVNIDGKQSIRIKRGRDVWCSDGRLPREIQLGEGNFRDLEIDRGHMVRREDPNWSAAVEDARAQAEAAMADEDTFHYVNAIAQHSRLNQGKALWQGLENYILDSARTHGFRACVFTGPVLAARDDADADTVLDGAVVPREFWKLVVTLADDPSRLHATAYLLSQGELIRSLLEKRGRREAQEGFALGAYRTFQLAVSDLADATGYDFSAYVDADPLRAMPVAEAALSRREPVVLPIEELADLRL